MNSGRVRVQLSPKWLTHHGNQTHKLPMCNGKVGVYIGLPEWQEVGLNYRLCRHTVSPRSLEWRRNWQQVALQLLILVNWREIKPPLSSPENLWRVGLWVGETRAAFKGRVLVIILFRNSTASENYEQFPIVGGGMWSWGWDMGPLRQESKDETQKLKKSMIRQQEEIRVNWWNQVTKEKNVVITEMKVTFKAADIHSSWE